MICPVILKFLKICGRLKLICGRYIMKHATKILYSLVAMLALTCPTLNADVVIGAAEFYDDWQLGTMLATKTGALTVIVDDQGGGSYEFSTGLIGMAYRLFSSSYGLEFIPVQASDSQNRLVPGTSVQTFSLNETKYYAYWEDVFGTLDDPDSADNYGWVSLTYTGSDLEITDSSTALGGGIIVGTYTQIPEPSSVLLLTFGSGGILFYRRAKRRQQEQHVSRHSFH